MPASAALLLTHDSGWASAVADATRRLGRDLICADTPAQAMAMLSGMHCFAHLIVEPRAAGDHMPSLVAMACGEAQSGVDLVVLGSGSGGCFAHKVMSPDSEVIGHALGLPPSERRAPDPEPFDRAQLNQLMRNGSVVIRLQPLASLADRRVMGFEVLARLTTPACGTLAPDRFVPAIERLGLGAALLGEVARAAFTIAPTLGGAALAINLPLDMLLAEETAPALDALRAEAGLPAHRVIIELTESQRVDDVRALMAALVVWRAAGYQLAIDDAGPELPNHRALFRLPFDYVKLDATVVRSALLSPASRTYLARTVAIAHGQSLSVIAEGVETQAAWDMLASFGVDVAQGFMIGRPLPVGAVPAWRAAWGAPVAVPA